MVLVEAIFLLSYKGMSSFRIIGLKKTYCGGVYGLLTPSNAKIFESYAHSEVFSDTLCKG